MASSGYIGLEVDCVMVVGCAQGGVGARSVEAGQIRAAGRADTPERGCFGGQPVPPKQRLIAVP